MFLCFNHYLKVSCSKVAKETRKSINISNQLINFINTQVYPNSSDIPHNLALILIVLPRVTFSSQKAATGVTSIKPTSEIVFGLIVFSLSISAVSITLLKYLNDYTFYGVVTSTNVFFGSLDKYYLMEGLFDCVIKNDTITRFCANNSVYDAAENSSFIGLTSASKKIGVCILKQEAINKQNTIDICSMFWLQYSFITFWTFLESKTIQKNFIQNYFLAFKDFLLLGVKNMDLDKTPKSQWVEEAFFIFNIVSFVNFLRKFLNVNTFNIYFSIFKVFSTKKEFNFVVRIGNFRISFEYKNGNFTLRIDLFITMDILEYLKPQMVI